MSLADPVVPTFLDRSRKYFQTQGRKVRAFARPGPPTATATVLRGAKNIIGGKGLMGYGFLPVMGGEIKANYQKHNRGMLRRGFSGIGKEAGVRDATLAKLRDPRVIEALIGAGAGTGVGLGQHIHSRYKQEESSVAGRVLPAATIGAASSLGASALLRLAMRRAGSRALLEQLEQGKHNPEFAGWAGNALAKDRGVLRQAATTRKVVDNMSDFRNDLRDASRKVERLQQRYNNSTNPHPGMLDDIQDAKDELRDVLEYRGMLSGGTQPKRLKKLDDDLFQRIRDRERMLKGYDERVKHLQAVQASLAGGGINKDQLEALQYLAREYNKQRSGVFGRWRPSAAPDLTLFNEAAKKKKSGPRFEAGRR